MSTPDRTLLNILWMQEKKESVGTELLVLKTEGLGLTQRHKSVIVWCVVGQTPDVRYRQGIES